MIGRALGLSGLVASIVLACSLDLDESLLDRSFDGGVLGPDGAPVDAATSDGAADAGGATPCTTDDPCKSTDSCLRGSCDLQRKRCVYDLCRPKACGVSACDLGPKTCGAETAYKFFAGQFPLGATILGARAAAAIHPYLFVATSAGLLVFEISNPANAAPRQVPVTGLGFIPLQVVATEGRVWLRGNATGAGPSRMPVAWIDPPADPYAASLTAHTVLTTYDRPAAEGVTLFGRPGDAALFAGPPDATTPLAIAAGPLSEPASLTSKASGVKDLAALATSGKRLVLSSTVAEAASFAVVDDAGGADQKANAAVVLAGAAVSTSQRVDSSMDGAVFWIAGVHAGASPDARTRALKGFFLTANDTAPLATDVALDIEVYGAAGDVMPNDPVAGPVSTIDAKTVLVTARAKEDPLKTAAEIITRDPLEVKTNRRALLPVPVTAFVAATASHGLVHVIANVPGPPPPAPPTSAGTVYTFDPGCDL